MNLEQNAAVLVLILLAVAFGDEAANRITWRPYREGYCWFGAVALGNQAKGLSVEECLSACELEFGCNTVLYDTVDRSCSKGSQSSWDNVPCGMHASGLKTYWKPFPDCLDSPGENCAHGAREGMCIKDPVHFISKCQRTCGACVEDPAKLLPWTWLASGFCVNDLSALECKVVAVEIGAPRLMEGACTGNADCSDRFSCRQDMQTGVASWDDSRGNPCSPGKHCMCREAETRFDPSSPLVSYVDDGSCGIRGNDATADLSVCAGGASSASLAQRVSSLSGQAVARIGGCDYLSYEVYICRWSKKTHLHFQRVKNEPVTQDSASQSETSTWEPMEVVVSDGLTDSASAPATTTVYTAPMPDGMATSLAKWTTTNVATTLTTSSTTATSLVSTTTQTATEKTSTVNALESRIGTPDPLMSGVGHPTASPMPPDVTTSIKKHSPDTTERASQTAHSAAQKSLETKDSTTWSSTTALPLTRTATVTTSTTTTTHTKSTTWTETKTSTTSTATSTTHSTTISTTISTTSTTSTNTVSATLTSTTTTTISALWVVGQFWLNISGTESQSVDLSLVATYRSWLARVARMPENCVEVWIAPSAGARLSLRQFGRTPASSSVPSFGVELVYTIRVTGADGGNDRIRSKAEHVASMIVNENAGSKEFEKVPRQIPRDGKNKYWIHVLTMHGPSVRKHRPEQPPNAYNLNFVVAATIVVASVAAMVFVCGVIQLCLRERGGRRQFCFDHDPYDEIPCESADASTAFVADSPTDGVNEFHPPGPFSSEEIVGETVEDVTGQSCCSCKRACCICAHWCEKWRAPSRNIRGASENAQDAEVHAHWAHGDDYDESVGRPEEMPLSWTDDASCRFAITLAEEDAAPPLHLAVAAAVAQKKMEPATPNQQGISLERDTDAGGSRSPSVIAAPKQEHPDRVSPTSTGQRSRAATEVGIIQSQSTAHEIAQASPEGASVDESNLAALINMGFARDKVVRALQNSGPALSDAMDALFNGVYDEAAASSGGDLVPASSAVSLQQEEAITQLADMGFDRTAAFDALSATGWKTDDAIQHLVRAR